MSSAPVLILGATGRVGSALARQLVVRGAPVRAATRSPDRLESRAGVSPVPFDLQDETTWPVALASVRALFLLWPPGTPPRAALPFVDAACAAGVRRVAFLSVLGADRMGFLPHARIERQVSASPARSVFLRAGYFFQNISTIHADDIRDRDEVFLPTGNGRISMVDVEDVAAAAVVGLLDRDDDLAWDLTGPAALSSSDVAAQLSEALGRPIRDARPGLWRFYRSHLARGTDPVLARFMCAEYTHARLGLAARLGTGVEAALGRAPTPFVEFARREATAWARNDE